MNKKVRPTIKKQSAKRPALTIRLVFLAVTERNHQCPPRSTNEFRFMRAGPARPKTPSEIRRIPSREIDHALASRPMLHARFDIEHLAVTRFGVVFVSTTDRSHSSYLVIRAQRLRRTRSSSMPMVCAWSRLAFSVA